MKDREEINLDKSAPITPSTPTVSQAKMASELSQDTDRIGKIYQRVGKLSKKIDSAMSQSDIIDSIVSTPTSEMIQWEDVELPSMGRYYNWTSGVIKVRPWGADVDEILATQRLIQTGQAIDMMLAKCCRFPDGFDPVDLLVGDQIFLLYYLRGITHGNMYDFAVQTPTNDTIMTSIDFNELARTINWANPNLGPEPFKIPLECMSEQAGTAIWLRVRFMRVKDSQIISRQKKARAAITGNNSAKVKSRKEKMEHRLESNSMTRDQIPIDDTLTQNLSRLVVSVMDDVTERFKIEQFVKRMHSSDIATVREWLADNSPGMETQVSVIDPSNDQEFKVMLPITESFFRPQVPRTLRT